MKSKMSLKSSAVSAVFRAVALVSVIGASTFAASMAVAALSPADQSAADALALTLAEAIEAASEGGGDRQQAVEAAIIAALAASGADPIVQNAALAAAARSPTVMAVIAVDGVQDAIFAQKTTVLAAAIVEAANAAGADPDAIEAAIDEVVTTASVTPDLAATAMQEAQSSGDLNPAAQLAVNTIITPVQQLADAEDTGATDTEDQPEVVEVVVGPYVG